MLTKKISKINPQQKKTNTKRNIKVKPLESIVMNDMGTIECVTKKNFLYKVVVYYFLYDE